MKQNQAVMFALVTQSDIIRTFILGIFSGFFIHTLLFPLPSQNRRAGEGEGTAAGARMQEEHPQAAPALGTCHDLAVTA